MSLIETRLSHLEEVPGYQRVLKRLTDNGWPDAQKEASIFFVGWDENHDGAYLPLVDKEDRLALVSYQRLSQFDLNTWKKYPHDEKIPNHMLAARVKLNNDILFQGLDLQQSKENINWANFTYQIDAQTTGRGSFGDITGYSLSILIPTTNENADRVEVDIDEVGFRITEERNKEEQAKDVAEYLKENPDHLAILVAKAAIETEKVLKQRS